MLPPSIPKSAFTFSSAAPPSNGDGRIVGATSIAGIQSKAPSSVSASATKATKASSKAAPRSKQQQSKPTGVLQSAAQAVQLQQSVAQQLPSRQQQQQQQRAWSPPRPPLSPILPVAELPPHLAPTTTGSGTFYTPSFVSGRAVFTHTEAAREAAAQRAAAASAAVEPVAGGPHPADPHAEAPLPPAPLPIDFASNTDVLALQSTIAILQLQKKRATADIQALQQAKVAALAQPEAFLRQLQGIQQGIQQGKGSAADDSDSDSDSDSGSDNKMGDGDEVKKDDANLSPKSNGPSNSTLTAPPPGRRIATAKGRLQHQQSASSQTSSSDTAPATAAASAAPAPSLPDLRKLPQPQNIVRMPPINWNKYAVVGEGLEKLHADQLRRPPVGAPAAATLLPHSGQNEQALYTFQGGLENAAAAAALAPVAPDYHGIASPYDPLKDVLGPEGTADARLPQPAAPAQASTSTRAASTASGNGAVAANVVSSAVAAPAARRGRSSVSRR